MRRGARPWLALLALALLASPAAPVRADEPAPPDPEANSRHGPIRTLGDWGQYLTPAAAAGIAVSKGDTAGVQQLARGCGYTLAGTWALKQIFDHTFLGERPDGQRHSFPSGHMATAMCGAAFVHERYREERYTAPLAAAGAFVGYSRVWARKHHWRDVLAATGLAMSVAHNTTHRRDARRAFAPPLLAAPGPGPELAGASLLFAERGAAAGGAADLESAELFRGVRGGLELGTRLDPAAPAQTYVGLRLDGAF